MALATIALVSIPEVGTALALWVAVAAACGAASQSAFAYIGAQSGKELGRFIGAGWLVAISLLAMVAACSGAIGPTERGELRANVAYALAYAAVPLLVAVALVSAFVERTEA